MTQPEIDYGMRRFAVLYHTGVEEPHYDLLFDTSDNSQLITFRVGQWPLLRSQMATKLRDHRRAYLTFQGIIDGDRGQVHRVDEGQFHVIQTFPGWKLLLPSGELFATIEPENPQDSSQSEWWISLPENPS